MKGMVAFREEIDGAAMKSLHRNILFSEPRRAGEVGLACALDLPVPTLEVRA